METQQKDQTTLIFVLGTAVVVLLAAFAVVTAALVLQDPEVKTVTKTRTVQSKAPVQIRLPRDTKYDGAQVDPSGKLPFKIVCTGYSNRPGSDTSAANPDIFTKKMIGYRVVTDCRTISSDPQPTLKKKATGPGA